ncbi:unnamed protein product [Symbiodinium pilosum]|uniref:TIR domain-containing protein n=1 Tax=Symbiodinium pilosum TaxID=2952 RepID=A0A812IQ13_SYMPI|nr:unnamed protein product [Symbiodinium pilosum]
MFSMRFDSGEVEQKIRAVHRLLLRHNYEVRMVEAGAGDDFGDDPLRFLLDLKRNGGVMLAVCTAHYAEMTASRYSSHEELRYCHEHRIQVLPLRMDDIYPPEPPWGPSHPYDEMGRAEALVSLALPPSLPYVDCRGKTVEEIASGIAARLRRS